MNRQKREGDDSGKTAKKTPGISEISLRGNSDYPSGDFLNYFRYHNGGNCIK